MDETMLKKLDDMLEAEVHRVFKFVAYPHEMEKPRVDISVLLSPDGDYRITATTEEGGRAVTNPHPTFEGACSNFMVHMWKVGLAPTPPGAS